MRTTKVGQFDAVITIFNAIGHLTKQDFCQALQNIHRNLKAGGLYVFDIFNLTYLLTGDNITKLTIDWLKRSGDTVTREIQYSTIANDGVLASYDRYYEQQGHQPPTVSEAYQTLQVYSAAQLTTMLTQQGFCVLQQSGIDGSLFNARGTDRLLTVAAKV